MPKIQKLKPEVIKKISAGEVVERPASVIKELVENAIDAKATHIKIYLENGGKTLIKISDNGEGIEKQDLEIILEPHTTSKIQEIEDIYAINTLGFRGEALHAISSVSKFSIKTRHQKSNMGYELVNFPQFKITPTSREQGTTIIVKDLFYNIPARQKFLKSDKTELKHILEIIEAYALTYNQIQFEVFHNNKQILFLPKNQTKKQRIASILKIDEQSIIDISHSYFNYKMHAYIPNQKIQLQNRGFFKLFVNHRYIINNTLKKATQQALVGFVPKDTHISAVLELFVPPHIIDVNIHPRKLEIKFENPYRIFAFVKHGIQNNISKLSKSHFSHIADSTQSIDELPGSNQSPIYLQNANTKFDSKLDIAYQRLRNINPETPNNQTFNQDPNQISNQAYHQNTYNQNVQNSHSQYQPFFLKDSSQLTNPYQPQAQDLITHLKNEFQNSTINNIMQIFKKYILVEIGSELWIIDQHAAYERIRFEKLLNKQKIKTQQLLKPIEINISASQIPIIKQIKNDLKKLGFQIKLKEQTVLIYGIPNILKQNEITSTFFKAISNVSNPEQALSEFKNINNNKYEILVATFACHTAIRTGDTLNKLEMKQLVEDLLACKVPTSCPHGRPTVYKMSISDIDKFFLRTY